MIIIGIDPGKTGGIATLPISDDLCVTGPTAIAMPADEEAIAKHLRSVKELGRTCGVMAYIELVHAMPATRQVRDPERVKRVCVEINGAYSHRVAAILEREGVGVETKTVQGIVGTFTFAQGYGLLRGILRALEIKVVDVRPQDWQRVNGCMTRGNKNISKARASQLFPQLPRVTHATADALLIARFGYKVFESDERSRRQQTIHRLQR